MKTAKNFGLLWNIMYIRGMYSNINLFKIETNHVVPAQGKVLISEPFLCDHMFGRSVILLVDHTHDGTMGLVLNKPLPLFLNDVLKDFDCPESIPIYKGGPLSTDTLFYLHTLEGITGALSIGKGFYLNGDFEAIKTTSCREIPFKAESDSSWDTPAGSTNNWAGKLKKTPGW